MRYCLLITAIVEIVLYLYILSLVKYWMLLLIIDTNVRIVCDDGWSSGALSIASVMGSVILYIYINYYITTVTLLGDFSFSFSYELAL